MPYTLPSWQDAPSTATPISSANLLLGNTAIQGLDSRLGMVETGKVSTGLVNAKGKLISSDNAATPTALLVGTDGQVLTADASATLGLRWATPTSGGGSVNSVTAGDSSIVVAGTGTAPTVAINATGTPGSTTFLRGDRVWAAPAGASTPDATASVKGILQLAGDLAGTAASPAINATGTPSSTTFLRGDRTWSPVITSSRPFVTLTDATSIATDASLGSNFKVTITANRTLGAPTNLTDGQELTWEIIQDATGGRTLAFNAIFVQAISTPSLTVNATANAVTVVGGKYDAAQGKIYLHTFTAVNAGRIIKNQTTNLTFRPALAFSGSGVVASDDSVNNQTLVTIPGQNAMPTPEAQNLVSWTGDPAVGLGGTAPVGGTVYLVKLLVPPGGATITRIFWYVTSAFTTAANSQTGLYDSTGLLLASASVVSSLGSAGDKVTTISSTAIVEPFVWVGFVFNAATLGAIGRGTSGVVASNLLNIGLAADSYRFGINGTGQTALPGIITPSANSASILAYWAAIAA